MLTKKIILILFLFNAIFIQSKDKISLDIEKSVYMSLINNKDLKVSKAVLNIKNKAFFYELRKFLPTISMGFSNNNSVSMDAPDSHSVDLNLGLDILTFDGGKIIFNYISNKIELEFTKKELIVQINKIVSSTKNEYYSLILLLEKEKLQNELLNIGKIQEEHAELELELGKISKIDYYDIKVKVKQIQIDLEKVKREKRNAISDFAYELGIENYDIEVSDNINYEILTLNDDDISYFQNIALSNRMDLSQSFHSVMKNKVQYWYTILGFLPEVTTSVRFNLTGEEFPPRDKGWSINFGIKIPLAYLPFNMNPGLGGKGVNASKSTSSGSNVDAAQNLTYENDVAQAKINLATEGIKHKELVREIMKQIKNSIEDYVESTKIYKLKLEQNQLGLNKLNIMRIKLELGDVKRVDLLEEEMKYNQSLMEEKSMLFGLIKSEIVFQENLGVQNIDIKSMLDNIKTNNLNNTINNEVIYEDKIIE